MGLFTRKRTTDITASTTKVVEELHRPAATGQVPKKPKIGRALGGIPIIGELMEIGPLIPKIAEIFQDKSGRMSSKRMGAGAFSIAGIALVQAGAQSNNAMQFWGGIVLATLGVVLFGLTKWEGGEKDEPDA